MSKKGDKRKARTVSKKKALRAVKDRQLLKSAIAELPKIDRVNYKMKGFIKTHRLDK